jgi:hypothetical protein
MGVGEQPGAGVQGPPGGAERVAFAAAVAMDGLLDPASAPKTLRSREPSRTAPSFTINGPKYAMSTQDVAHGFDDCSDQHRHKPLSQPETQAERVARLGAENAQLRAEKARIETEKSILRQAAKYFAGETHW